MELHIVVLCTLFVVLAKGQHNFDVVRTSSGLVKGVNSTTHFLKLPYLSFRGIPYAEPPVGVLRFRPPQPILPWSGVRDCSEYGAVCPQYNITTASEDCLTLNVFTRKITGKRAVMVFFHVGANYYGSGDLSTFNGPDILMEQDVVLVILTYRLGVLGNLALDDSVITGNQGMKDQQLGLRWIHQNVDAFGGDPKRITVFGLSSGGSNVQLHLLAPGSQGLFQRAIIMSTGFMDRQTLRPANPVILKKIYDFFRQRNQMVDNTADLTKLLMQVSAIDLARHFSFERFGTLPMPTIEAPTASYPFIQGSPGYFSFEENFNLNVDVLVGYYSNEGIGVVDTRLFERFKNNLEMDVPTFKFNLDYSSKTYKAAQKLIFDRYFPAGLTANDTLANFVQLIGDVYYKYPVDRIVRRLAQQSTGKTYHYVFDLDTAMNFTKRYFQNWTDVKRLEGAAHGDDLCYILYCAYRYPDMYRDVVPGTNAYNQMRAMSRMFAQFAKTGRTAWGEVAKTGKAVKHLHIGARGFEERENGFEEGRRFWDGIVRMFDIK